MTVDELRGIGNDRPVFQLQSLDAAGLIQFQEILKNRVIIFVHKIKEILPNESSLHVTEE